MGVQRASGANERTHTCPNPFYLVYVVCAPHSPPPPPPLPFARIVKRKQYKRVGKKRQGANRRQNNNRKRRKSLKFLERRALRDCAISHWLRNFKRASAALIYYLGWVQKEPRLQKGCRCRDQVRRN